MEKTLNNQLPGRCFARCKALLLCLLFACGPLMAQNITLTMERATIKTILREIQTQTNYRFVYNDALVEMETITSLIVKDAPLLSVLKQLLEGKGIAYEIKDNQVILFPQGQAPPTSTLLTVRGTVTSAEDATPVSFVTVTVKGNDKLITSTDLEGKFVLPNVPANALLVFSFIGYSTQEIAVNNRTVVNISIYPDATILDEAMVVAYGTVKRGSYSGSASVVRNETIKDVPMMSVEQALAGSVPGMHVSAQSGQLGSQSEIRVRGIGSFNAGNNPLYVVDGIAMISGDLAGFSLWSIGSSNFLDAANIESVTVLKDAAAASLYGARGANGVILITTKTGKQGKAITTFKTSFGFSDFAVNNYPLVTDQEHEMLTREMVTNYAEMTPSVWNNATYNYSMDNYVNNRTEYYYPSKKEGWEYVNWRKTMFRVATTQNYELSVSGGNSDSRLFASASYNDAKGISLLNQMKRVSSSVNANHKVTKFLNLGINTQYVFTDQDGYQEAAGNRDDPWFLTTTRLTPRFAFKKPDGTYAHFGPAASESYDGTVFRNPYADMDYQIGNSKQYRTLLKGFAELDILQCLKLKSIISFDNTRTDTRYAWMVGHQLGQQYANGYVADRFVTWRRLVSSSTLNFNKTFLDKHTTSIMVGWEAEDQRRLYTDLSKNDFANFALTSTYLASEIRNAYTMDDVQTLLSFISNFNYEYDSRYYFTATYRKDGSSRLGPETRWGNFWSVSGSWRLGNESFVTSIDWINDLKFRGSYGTNGRLPSSFYAWQTLYAYGRYDGDNASYPSSYASRNLSWETNYAWNVALEGEVFNRFSFTADYYNRTTKDMLLSANIPSVTGFTSSTKNTGSMLNRGVELSCNVKIFKNTDLKWEVGLNWSTLHNEILALSEEDEIQVSAPYIRTKGYSFYQYYTREYLGADPQNGLPMYYTNTPLTDKGIFGPTEKEITNVSSQAASVILEGKTGIPKGFGGITSKVSYKNLSLSLNFNYEYGHYVWDRATLYIRHDGYYPFYNMSKDMLRRWQKPGDVTDVSKPMISNQGRSYNSDAWLYKGDFLRLKNVTLSYNLPKEMLSKISIKSARAYMSGANVLTLTGLDFDPEVTFGGDNSWSTPPIKTLTFGLEISF